jgi:competence protein ComEC
MHNGQVYFFSDSVLMSDRDKLRFHIRPNRLRNGVGEIYDGHQQTFVRTLNGCKLIVWNGLRILQLDEKDCKLPETLQVDYVLLGSNAVYDVKSLTGLKFEKLILDSSNSFYFAERMLKDAEAGGIPVHSVQHHGAFIAKL